nr:hypothetical protein [Tanacetum cinerariifolium]
MATTSNIEKAREDKGRMVIAELEVTNITDLRPIHSNKTVEATVYRKWTSKHIHTRHPTKYCCFQMLFIQAKVVLIQFNLKDLKVRIKGGKEKEIKKGLRNRNSCSLYGCIDHNKRTCTSMFKDQDEVVVAQDEVVQEKVDLVENEEELN